MLKKLLKFIKLQDRLGKPAVLNFKENHKTHRTLLGGILSLLGSLSLSCLIFFKFQDMFLKQNNELSSYSTVLDVDGLPGISLNTSGMNTYFVFQNQSENSGPVYLSDELSRYIDIYYNKKKINWSKSLHDGRFEEKRVPAR
jgi:hypothetical protein